MKKERKVVADWVKKERQEEAERKAEVERKKRGRVKITW